MAKLSNKDICFWVVPSKDGKVRKLRIGIKTLALGVGAGLLVAGAFIFVASDYARIQVLRVKSHFYLKKITEERDQLKNTKETLAGQVEGLKSENDRVLTYEQNVRHRLDELAAIIRSANSLGLVGKEDRLNQKAPEKGGVGGAEVICEGKGGDRCADMQLSADEPIPGDEADAKAMLRGSAFITDSPALPNVDLLEQLDRYIDLVRVLPFGVPANGAVSSGFGFRNSPFHNGLSMHEGIDFSLAEGSQILSTGDGVVKEVKRCSTYGLMIDIAHNDRVVTRYAHLSKTLVTEGQKICRGEVIGLAGSTGHSTGPHLHYEVLVSDKPHNPVRYIEMAARLNRVFG